METAQNPLAAPEYSPKQFLPPVLNQILAISTAQTAKPQCPLQHQFQALGRVEQGRGGGVNWFTRCKSLISFLGSCARGLRLNMAQGIRLSFANELKFNKSMYEEDAFFLLGDSPASEF